jgi:hypothetical protein
MISHLFYLFWGTPKGLGWAVIPTGKNFAFSEKDTQAKSLKLRRAQARLGLPGCLIEGE